MLPGMKLCGIFLFAFTLLFVGAVEAQQSSNLTRAQEGRAEVAKCYARCMSSPEPSTFTRIILDASDGEWSTTALQLTACLTDQGAAQGQDACSSGCRDIEAAYGVKSSYIRTRYYWRLNRLLRSVRASGLWTAWNRFPEVGSDAFTRACVTYTQATANSATTNIQALEEFGSVDLFEFESRRQEVIANEVVPELPYSLEEWE